MENPPFVHHVPWLFPMSFPDLRYLIGERNNPLSATSKTLIPSGVIKHGWLDNPLSMEVYFHRKIAELNSVFSSRPCLMIPEGKPPFSYGFPLAKVGIGQNKTITRNPEDLEKSSWGYPG